MASGGSIAGSGPCLLRLVVLAAAPVARLPCRNGGCSTLAMLAAFPSGLGFAVALRCVWDFGWTDTAHLPLSLRRGDWSWWVSTATCAAPCTWASQWAGSALGLLRHANPVAITAVAAVALAAHLFVVFYEEPTLRKKFGADYEEYRQNVGRWWPHVRTGKSHSIGAPSSP